MKFLKKLNRLAKIDREVLILFLGSFAGLIVVGTDILTSQYQRNIIDAIVAKNNEVVKKYIILICVFMASAAVLNFIKNYGNGKFGEDYSYKLRVNMFKDVTRLPNEYYDKNSSGDLVSRLTNDLEVASNFIRSIIIKILLIVPRLLCPAVYLFILNAKLAVFSLVLTPILFIITLKMSKPVKKYSKLQSIELGHVNNISKDTISGMPVVKAFNLENIFRHKYNKAVDKAVEKGIKASAAGAVTQGMGNFMNMLPSCIICAYGGYLGVKGELSFGSLFAFIQVINYVLRPMREIPRIINTTKNAAASIDRLYEVYIETKERCDGECFEKHGTVAIEFDNVEFGYDDKTVLDKLTFSIKEGEKVALVGHSGCGKSTVAKLITGFYRPNKGIIKVYGQDIQKWNLKKLRSFMSLVTQDNFLFPESIAENIRYGREDASKAEISEAAKVANINEFIKSLPENYETILGERGVNVSGGQRQRISIARAVIKNAPILLLDEATSALDVESESEVQKALDSLMKDRTSIIIAHRLSTIINADRILVIEEGKIVEEGTHEELLKKDSFYSSLYSTQFSEENSDSRKESVMQYD
jgi:ABC-type multidrug transport system fused ATPase/permease subunit